ncbi:MAG: hypothetical protein WDO74_00610 [Pseudomonadota bacterium]
MSLRERLRSTLIHRLRKHSVVSLVRLACWVALVGLAVMAASIVNPAPLTVIFAMSVGQVIGIVAFLCFLLSILMDVVRGTAHSPDAPGPAQNLREPSSPSDVTGST